MGTAKLMTPLFYDGNYNVEKKRMRAVLEREVSNGAVSYRLWRSDGKPDLEYPRAANDAYILHVEVNDHLVPLRMTDYALVNHCGLLPATIALYGSEEGREEYFKHLRDSGAAGTGAFTEAMARETEKIIELGNDSARQADYIKSVLDQHVAAFLDSKECDGKSFPDFVGALILEEIPSCLALRTKYRAYKQEEALKRQAEQEEQDRAFCEERNRKAEQMIDLAIRTIRGGGTLKNEPISLYKSRYDSSTYSIVNHLMRRYQVDVPLRTQGWINDKESHDPEPLELSVSDAAEILRDNGVEEEQILAFRDSCVTQFGDGATLNPANLIDSSRFEVKTADATISVDPEHSYLVEARIIDGRKYLLIPADEDIEVNGFGVRVKGE